MAKVKIELNEKAVGQLLKSKAVQADLEKRANRIKAAAGPGHGSAVQVQAHRARAAVWTTTVEAMLAEARTGNLTRAIDAGRG